MTELRGIGRDGLAYIVPMALDSERIDTVTISVSDDTGNIIGAIHVDADSVDRLTSRLHRLMGLGSAMYEEVWFGIHEDNTIFASLIPGQRYTLLIFVGGREICLFRDAKFCERHINRRVRVIGTSMYIDQNFVEFSIEPSKMSHIGSCYDIMQEILTRVLSEHLKMMGMDVHDWQIRALSWQYRAGWQLP